MKACWLEEEDEEEGEEREKEAEEKRWGIGKEKGKDYYLITFFLPRFVIFNSHIKHGSQLQ